MTRLHQVLSRLLRLLVVKGKRLVGNATAPAPTLPAELLIKIVGMVAQTTDFDFLQPAWAKGVDTKALHALTLTSTVLNGIATPVLYSHLVVLDERVGGLLARTLRSDRWQTGEMAGKASEWVKCASFGQPTTDRIKSSGWYAEVVLSELVAADLERVAFTGLRVDSGHFHSLRGLKMLNLNGVDYNVGPAPTDCLPSLTHLRLTNSTLRALIADPTLRTLRMPLLTHLMVTGTSLRSCPDIALVAAQLELVAFDTSFPDLIGNFDTHAPKMSRLQTLALIGPFERANYARGSLLSRLPRPLETLDLAKSLVCETSAATVLDSFRRADAATSQLRVIILPSKVRFARTGRRDVRRAKEVGLEVAEAAEARGVRVEWA